MRSPFSLAAFTANIVLAIALAIGGVVEILAPFGSSLLGVVLIVAGGGLSAYARNARAAYLHQQKMAGLRQWAQGLGPEGRQERRRP